MSNIISPQGYHYGESPEADNPFWDDEEIADSLTATATVDNSTGVPSVDVSKNGYNLNFDFKNLKGEKGDTGATGPQGEPGTDGATGAQGPQGEPGEAGKDGTNGISPTVVSTGNTGSSESAGTITGADGTVVTVYNGAQGEKGDKGDPGDATNAVSGISLTNENGVYTLKQTKDGTESEVGTIEVPAQQNIDNLIAEVNDSIVENTTDGYDFHTITETEHNGEKNNVGSFYVARKQITELNSDGSFTTVNQSGETGTGQINVGSNFSGSYIYTTFPTITATPSVGFKKISTILSFKKNGSNDSTMLSFNNLVYIDNVAGVVVINDTSFTTDDNTGILHPIVIQIVINTSITLYSILTVAIWTDLTISDTTISTLSILDITT